jgi:hypothetical protein
LLTSKFLLLFNQVSYAAPSEERVLTSERFIFRIVDQSIGISDINFQLRNLQGLDCVNHQSLIVRYFGKGFPLEMTKFLKDLPLDSAQVPAYLHVHQELLKKMRIFFKLLRYADDQQTTISLDIRKLVRESAKEYKCNTEILYKDDLKSNFKQLLRLEMYLRGRYGSQLADKRSFESIKQSMELFMDSLDKQFAHEYFW